MMTDTKLWLALTLVATLATVWNVRWLHAHKPRLDMLAGIVGSIAIVALIAGAALFRSQIQQLGVIDMVADLATCGALISFWLRSDACRLLVPARHSSRSRTRRVGF
jgi:hypothetical protein